MGDAYRYAATANIHTRIAQGMHADRWEIWQAYRQAIEADLPCKLPDWYGMTLRDHFAGKAMQGLIEYDGQSDGKEPLARQAYEIADAMMLERAK